MTERFIFVEPNIENGEIINSFFYKNNPDSVAVKPHICLVFPFKSDLDISVINEVIEKTMNKYKDFEIQLEGLSLSYEENNNFLFLNVIDENNILKNMCEELYSLLGDNATLRGEYTPHITIGKSKSINDINKMYSEAKELLKGKFNASISSVNSKIIIEENEKLYLEDEITYDLLNKKTNKSR